MWVSKNKLRPYLFSFLIKLSKFWSKFQIIWKGWHVTLYNLSKKKHLQSMVRNKSRIRIRSIIKQFVQIIWKIYFKDGHIWLFLSEADFWNHGKFFCVLFLILYLSTFIKWSTNKMIEKHLEYNKLFRYDSYTSNHYIMKVRKRQENN